jgi:hypothetical protein
MVVIVKNAVFWEVMPCGSCKRVNRLLVTANIVPSSPILVTLMMRHYFPQKHWLLLEPQGITSQKMAFFLFLLLSSLKYLDKF